MCLWYELLSCILLSSYFEALWFNMLLFFFFSQIFRTHLIDPIVLRKEHCSNCNACKNSINSNKFSLFWKHIKNGERVRNEGLVKVMNWEWSGPVGVAIRAHHNAFLWGTSTSWIIMCSWALHLAYAQVVHLRNLHNIFKENQILILVAVRWWGQFGT